MARAGTTQPPVTLPDRYKVVRYLARGGMASVWEAEDRLLGRHVAVKVLAEHLAEDAGARERFQREARAAARVSSEQHVVTIYDVSQGEAGGQPFIVMELMPGGTVSDRLRERPPTRAETLDWLRQAAEAIDDSHRRGLVHRDIKPANLLLDGRGRLAVTDFGIARLAQDQNLTSTGQVLGTAAYLSPEQARGEAATPASDRYALAVVAFQLLTGEKPFQAEHFAAQARQHIDLAPPPASSIRPELPAGVDAALERGLAKDPDARWPTAGAMVDALERALDEAPAAGTAATRRLPSGGAAVPPISDFPLPPQRRRFARRRSGGGAALVGAGAAAADRRAATAGVRSPGKGAAAHSAAGTPGAAAADRRAAAGGGADARAQEGGASAPPRARPAPSSRPRRRSSMLAIAAVALVALVGAIVGLASSSSGRQLTARVDHATNKRAQSVEKHRTAQRRSSGRQTAPAAQTPQSAPAAGSGTGSGSGSGSGSGTGSGSGSGSGSASSGNPTALNAQGYQLLQSGNPQQAVPILRRAVDACNGDPSRLVCAYAMYNLAHALRLSGHPSQAVPLLEKRLQNPDQRATVERELALARAGSTSDSGGSSSGSAAGGSGSGAAAGGGKAGKGRKPGKGNGD
jgi:eukaryotic-like serine/threonine-protein kinase